MDTIFGILHISGEVRLIPQYSLQVWVKLDSFYNIHCKCQHLLTYTNLLGKLGEGEPLRTLEGIRTIIRIV